MRWLKMLGLAAFAGVAATGVVIIRDQRRRTAYTPDEVRSRLHARLAAPPDPPDPAAPPALSKPAPRTAQPSAPPPHPS
jgi:hypothetical protein